MNDTDNDERLILEAMTETAIFMLDTQGVIQRWYEGARILFGYKSDEVLGQHVSKFVSRGSGNAWISDALVSTAIQQAHVGECGWEHKDGSNYLAHTTVTALFSPQGHRGYVIVAQKRSDQRRDGPRDTDSSRIMAFMDMLAHELRNPLAPIANAIAILDREPNLSDRVLHVRDVIVRQSKQMTQVIDGLLDISRISEGKVELETKPVRLDTVIVEAVKMIESLIQIQSHTLTVDTGTEAVWVSGDKARLIQIVGNLLHNAAKFTPQCGAIRVAIAAEEGLAVVTVTDNGMGIEPARLPTLFSRFEQRGIDSDKTFGGLGLGLSLAQELIQLHGGSISASSTGISGEGCIFSVRLPRIAGPIDESEGRSSAAIKTVLIVDDNRDSAFVMTMLLEPMGYQCLTAYSGVDAVALIKLKRPSVVLLDIGLPDIDGYEVARRINEEMAKPPPVIALTGYGGHQDRRRSFKAGFSAHVVKPIDPDNLQMLLHTILAD